MFYSGTKNGIKTIALIPIVLVVLWILLPYPFRLIGWYESRQVDAQMEELCKKDGGLKIYETVALPVDQLKPNGSPIFFKTWNKSGGGYMFIAKDEYLKKDKPTLSKTTYMIVREADQKVLGVQITYRRIGGDIIPRSGPDSFKQCPTREQTSDITSVFVKQ